MWSVLAVEDDIDIQRLVHQALGSAVEVRCVGALEEAVESIERRHPDLVLLDISLPDGEGYQLCSALQNDEATREIPIIFLTARGHARDKITAFRLGADDYVEKPFEPEELCARVESRIAKRARRNENLQVLCKGGMRIDVGAHRVSTIGVDGEVWIDLTPHETRLLQHLTRQEDRVYSRAQLMEAVWGDSVVAERTVDSHVSNLRRKLGAAGEQILSVRGVGYRFRSHALKTSPDSSQNHDPKNASAQAPLKPATESSPEKVSSSMARQIVIDPQLWDLVPGYLERRRSDLRNLSDALASDDLATLRLVGHRMKGSGKTYGFHRISQLGGSLERAASEGDCESALGWIEELASYLDWIDPVCG